MVLFDFMSLLRDFFHHDRSFWFLPDRDSSLSGSEELKHFLVVCVGELKKIPLWFGILVADRENFKMIRRFVSRLLSYQGRVKVGADKYGNSYYLKQEMKEGALVERRWVEFKGEPDSTSLPVEWTSWLAGTRKGAPTPEEVAALEAHRENVKKMAELYEKNEEERRMKAKLTQTGVQADDLSLEDMKVMMRQISGAGAELHREGAEKTTQEESSHTKYTKVREGRESSEPSVWHPRTRETEDVSKKRTPVVRPSSTGTSEGQGQGDNFQHGIWRP